MDGQGTFSKYDLDHLRRKAEQRLPVSGKDVEALIERMAHLEEALEPFANIADLVDCETEGFADSDELGLYYDKYLFEKFPLSTFYTARAALKDKGE